MTASGREVLARDHIQGVALAVELRIDGAGDVRVEVGERSGEDLDGCGHGTGAHVEPPSQLEYI